MSFSTEVKEELMELRNLGKKEEVKAEFVGYSMSGNMSIHRYTAKLSTESKGNVERFICLLKNLEIEDYSTKQTGKLHIVKFNKPIEMAGIQFTYDKVVIETAYEEEVQSKEALEKAVIRGVFLGSGSVNNPENNYHLEMSVAREEQARLVEAILRKYGIEPKMLQKKNKISIYVKDSECISKFLALMGATKAVLKFEDVRVMRNIKNNVNRKVNCETANLNKIVNSAVKQIDAIEYIIQKDTFHQMPEPLQEMAKVRIENPDASLEELGKLLDSPISKSGVNHRLKAIEAFAMEIKEGKEKP